MGQTYTFTIENRGAEDASYRLYIENIEDVNISYSYTKNGITTTGTLANKTIDEANLKVGEKVQITITFKGTGSYKGKLKVETKDYYNNEPNAPKLVGDMIPVIWNGSSWVKADKENTNSSWYNYDKQMWANTVTIKDTNKRSEYKNAAAGTIIDLSYVNLMLVWIPRYSYTLRQSYGYQIEGASTPSQATPGAFDIKFVNTTTTEKGTGKYTGTTPSNYYTPSSFCWGNSCDVESTRSNAGNTELSGIWISKFELTGTITELSSIPNKPSINNQTNSSYFNNIKSQINGNNGSTNYGLNGNYDTHMIKNTEWGAMAYLSQSKYGKYGNSNYTGANKEIYINNYGVLTGCSKGAPGVGAYKSGASSTCSYTYEKEPSGTGASTTGTIYGIYDTSGGGGEQVMANLNNLAGYSGFSSMPERKYYNLYTGTTGIKGDATNADGTAGFYGDGASFDFGEGNKWLGCRGGRKYEGVAGGIFFFSPILGNGWPDSPSRLVITTW